MLDVKSILPPGRVPAMARRALPWALWVLAAALALQPQSASAFAIAVLVEAGRYHTCALLADSRVQCWGANESGQLGDGTLLARTLPVDVAGLGKVRSIGVGDNHVCALTEQGTVKCWGSNASGQLGDGTARSYSSIPVDVLGVGQGVRQLVVGTAHTCIIDAAQSALCWGENSAGQLGDASYADRNAPQEVWDLPKGVRSLAAGAANTVALMEDGRVYYWGRDGSKMVCGPVVCVPERNYRNRPRFATLLPRDFALLAAERGGANDLRYSMCGLRGVNAPVCWGGNFDGYGGENDFPLTSLAELSTPVVSLSLGGDQSCAVAGTGVVECWGANVHGQLGRGVVSRDPAFYLTPRPVLGGASWSAVTSGWRHVCGLTKTGGVKCWGDNSAGQLGIGGTSSPGEPTPMQVNGLEGIPTAPVPMVEFYHEELDHYFMTWVEHEIGELDAGTTRRGWRRTGKSFSAFVVPQTDTAPICRYYIPPPFGSSHFYGRGPAECGDVARKFPHLVLEQADFFFAVLPVGASCQGGTRPVYRVFNGRADANHRYMTDRAAREQMVAVGWLAEGDGPDLVVMCAPQ